MTDACSLVLQLSSHLVARNEEIFHATIAVSPTIQQKKLISEYDMHRNESMLNAILFLRVLLLCIQLQDRIVGLSFKIGAHHFPFTNKTVMKIYFLCTAYHLNNDSIENLKYS